MPVAGYSGTPLIQKLGIKPGMKLLVINQPQEYFLLLGDDISEQYCVKNNIPDLIHLFIHSVKEFKMVMKKLEKWVAKNKSVILWISWYKKSAKIPTDVTEDVIRNYALQHGLVDVKVCAVSDKWSGLKLVVPLAKRF